MSPSRFDIVVRRFASRTSRRGVFASGAALTGLAALAPRARAQEATPEATPASAGSTLAHTDADFLFVQVATDATWTPKVGEPGTYVLTMTHQDGQTIYFSDRPERIVGSAPTQAFLDGLGFTPANPPNAAIVAGEEVLVVELLNPAYDAAAGTLTYDAVPLEPESASEGLGHLANRQSDADLPADLGPTSLFIDSAQETCSNYTDCWYISSSSSGDCYVENAGTGLYSCSAGPIPGGPIDACYDWGAFSCEPCDSNQSYDSMASACNGAYPDLCSGDGGCVAHVGE